MRCVFIVCTDTICSVMRGKNDTELQLGLSPAETWESRTRIERYAKFLVRKEKKI